jgi:hypothetical protein
MGNDYIHVTNVTADDQPPCYLAPRPPALAPPAPPNIPIICCIMAGFDIRFCAVEGEEQ